MKREKEVRTRNELNDLSNSIEAMSFSHTPCQPFKMQTVVTIPFPEKDIMIPSFQLPASEILLQSLYAFIEKENVRSISEFGAGCGQYGTIIRRKYLEGLVYRGYDFAGDVEKYTESFVSYYDPGIPLNLPMADWIISFEAGHLLQPHKEGMMIRNLHAHNCKGIILTWGGNVQSTNLGVQSTDLHDEGFLIDIFSNLGYQFDVKETKTFRERYDADREAPWFV